MRIYIILLVCLISNYYLVAQTVNSTFNKTILFENKDLQVFISCRDTASIDQADWLNFVIKNKSKEPIFITDASYSMYELIKTSDRNSNIEYRYGEANKYSIFHYYYEKENPSDYREGIEILANEQLSSWKYLTNETSVSIEQRQRFGNICPLFHMNVSYLLNNREKHLSNKEIKFCFFWKPISETPKIVLSKRLKDALSDINQGIHYNIISELMKNDSVMELISNDILIEAILKGKRGNNNEENTLFLKELRDRNAIPQSKLTERYKKDLESPISYSATELMYYWDGDLIDYLLHSNIKLWNMGLILEANSKYWSVNSEYKSKIYNYLKQKTSFDEGLQPSEVNYTEWSKTVKLMSISRAKRIIDYLIPFLEDEAEFKVVDWSHYRNYGFLPEGSKPDTITVRVCDVAFVSLIRAINQTEYQNYYVLFNQNFIENVKPSSDYFYGRNFITYDLALAEKTIKLNSELKAKIKSYITDKEKFQFLNLQKGSH